MGDAGGGRRHVVAGCAGGGMAHGSEGRGSGGHMGRAEPAAAADAATMQTMVG